MANWREVCDIEYDQNNGVIAIQPTKNGKLSRLVKETNGVMASKSPEERCWVFADSYVYTDEAGEERIDHRRRGVVCGTYADGQAFLKMCSEIGLNVRSGGLFVPFSNGQRRNAHVLRPTPYTHEYMSDYPEEELRLMRWDLPSREDLMKIIAEK